MAELQQDAEATKSVEVEKPTRRLERKAKFVFNKCCFCIPLKTGSLILAYLYLIGTTVMAIYSLTGICMTIVVLAKYPDYGINTVVIMNLSLSFVSLTTAAIALPFNVFLVYGLHKEIRNFVKLYVKFLFAFMILQTIPIVVTTVMGYANSISAAFALVSLAFNIYYAFVMRSQYKRMGEAAVELPAQENQEPKNQDKQ